jgi:hypothetical protein
MDDVTDYLQAELRTSQAELDALRRQDEGVHARMAKLEAIVGGLRHLIAKRNPGTRLVPVDEWSIIPRTDAVFRILQASPEPLTPREVSKQLAAKGRIGDHPNAVSGALHRLKQSGRVEAVGSGRWLAATQVGRAEIAVGQTPNPQLEEDVRLDG